MKDDADQEEFSHDVSVSINVTGRVTLLIHLFYFNK